MSVFQRTKHCFLAEWIRCSLDAVRGYCDGIVMSMVVLSLKNNQTLLNPAGLVRPNRYEQSIRGISIACYNGHLEPVGARHNRVCSIVYLGCAAPKLSIGTGSYH